MQAKLQEIKKELRERMHQPIPTSTIMRCRRIVAHLHGSVTTSPISGFACSGGAARGTASRGNEERSWSTSGSRKRLSSIPGPASASPSITQGGSRVPESGSHGSVRGVLSNGRPYRDQLGKVGLAAPNLAELEVAKHNQASEREPPCHRVR